MVEETPDEGYSSIEDVRNLTLSMIENNQSMGGGKGVNSELNEVIPDISASVQYVVEGYGSSE